ncbi:hypothetical protein [Actinopolyspora mortivallis]|uniref:hypothetical protein n=1 Tax=Actinopolyspora mortivallis TaxID=33906 RepID=UPI001C636027|nr:hypothetical protein [Actinopolyspora mortivallis]
MRIQLVNKFVVLGIPCVVLGQSLGYGVLLYLLSLLERITEEWGLRLRLFALPFLTQDSPIAQVLIYTVPSRRARRPGDLA